MGRLSEGHVDTLFLVVFRADDTVIFIVMGKNKLAPLAP